MTRNEEKKLLIQKRNKLKEAKRYRGQFESKWKEYEKFYDGDQWKARENRPVKNFIFSTIEAETAILTDSRPGTDVVGLEQQHEEGAKMLESAIHYVYDKESLNMKLVQGVRESLIPGPSWLYVDYDFDAENGLGTPTIDNIEWQFVYIDPTANEIDKATYAFIQKPVRVDDAKRQYPKYADKIKAQKIDDKSSTVSDGRDEDRHRPFDNQTDEVSRYSGDDLTTLTEFWVKDYTYVPIPIEETQDEVEQENLQILNGDAPEINKYEEHQTHKQFHKEFVFETLARAFQLPSIAYVTPDVIEAAKQDENLMLMVLIYEDHMRMHDILEQEAAEQRVLGKKPKYKNFWRRSIWNCDILLEDGSPPVDDGMIPLVPIYAYKITKNIYGQGEIKNIIDSQKSYNDMDHSQYKQLRLSGNSGWLVDNTSGVEEDTLTNEEGIVITKNPDSNVQRLQPGVVSPQFETRKNSDKNDIATISGITEATQGKRPTGITAAQAIKYLQEQSIGRIRLKTRNLEEYTMLRLGKLVASRIVKYWTVERKLRVYDKEGTLQYVNFDPEKLTDLAYDVRMAPGSTAGLDKETIFTLMQGLLERGLITPKTFFHVTDVPYKIKILEDLEQSDQEKQMLEQLMLENQELKNQLGIPQEDLQNVQ